MNKHKGLFLTFEGPEASGKSSQILLLEKYLKKNKISFIITREPGGTKVAEILRNLILKVKSNINIEEEILMLMAARSHHINNVIKPALKKGSLVISDRFADSTFVYQGYRPSILVMSATPIPRTLTLAAYGDMDESRLIEKPIGRKPIKTSVLTLRKEKNLIERVGNKIKNSNDKFFWVCPLIEESQELDLKAATDRYNSLNKLFKNKVLLIHGQLNEKDKEAIMEKFKNEDYRILVATTVIEVGIDIKSATTIIIEHAERFGLAQLHQLRGRVGRNNEESYCILLHKEKINDTAKKRLNIMTETNDGFIIAEEDLKIRGPGEILGKRQSGLPSFNVADLSYDGDLLEEAKLNAEKIIKNDPKLENNKNLRDLLYIHERDTAIRTLNAG